MCFYCQATQLKDVIIKPDALDCLLLDKHADYIAAYGSKKDDYVSKTTPCALMYFTQLLYLFELIFVYKCSCYITSWL